MAESAQRNLTAMHATGVDKETIENAKLARVCPYDWGTPITEIANTIATDSNSREEASFDVVVAADCIYMPDFHKVLLESVNLLLSKAGVAIFSFALHGNTDDEKVWEIFDLAKEMKTSRHQFV